MTTSFGKLSRAAIVVGLLASGAQVRAHHSTANYDYTKTVTVVGTVKQLQWTNPHNFLQVLVPDGKGSAVEWSVEAGSPALARRLGWKPESFKQGDKVKVVMAPLRTGGPSGTLRSVTLPSGVVLYGPGNQGQLPAGLGLPTLERSSSGPGQQ